MMELDIISYQDLNDPANTSATRMLKTALLQKGIVGIKDVPGFLSKSQAYINAARQFSALSDEIKQQYAPLRDTGETEGYELGAEWFQGQDGVWRIDDKKSSFYACVPDAIKNKWPKEVDLKTPYLELGKLIFSTGKLLLNVMGLNEKLGLKHDEITGYGRMLHYHKESDAINENPNWCGAHLDHGIFTGLIPAYYYRDGIEVDEPKEAGLYIVPSNTTQFEKVSLSDKSVLLFQVGEFGQLLSDDHIQATQHTVRKAKGEIERYTFALFFSAGVNTKIKSHSKLIEDDRYKQHQSADGSISYAEWEKASYERYRAK
jgi:isopenicillin N synthase-like dioxygenase